jgi:hypothetical protein
MPLGMMDQMGDMQQMWGSHMTVAQQRQMRQ